MKIREELITKAQETQDGSPFENAVDCKEYVDWLLEKYHVVEKGKSCIFKQGHEGDRSYIAGNGFEIKFDYDKISHVIIVEK